MRKFSRLCGAVGLGIAGSLCCAVTAQAGQVTLSLVRDALTNVDDAGGRNQYEGGKVLTSGGSTVGHYITTRRVTTAGTTADNTAGTTTTLFFPSGDSNIAPNSIVVEGAWSFNAGAFDGSVSAAAPIYHWLIGAVAVETTTAGGGSATSALTFKWLGGSAAMTVP